MAQASHPKGNLISFSFDVSGDSDGDKNPDVSVDLDLGPFNVYADTFNVDRNLLSSLVFQALEFAGNLVGLGSGSAKSKK